MGAKHYTFLDLAKEILSVASAPLSASEIWREAVATGLDKRTGSVGKTPADTLAARLYVAVKKPGSVFLATTDSPKRFSLAKSAEAGQLDAAASAHAGSSADLPSKKTPKMGRTYSFTECAQKVLEQFGGKKPMHYRSITTKAVEQGWLDSNGLTPDATMYAQIITEIKRKQKRGEPPRFVQHGRGYIGLSRWIGKGLRFQIEEHNKDICKALHKHLMSITPAAFEELIGKLLGFMGFDEPQVTSRNGDGGIDVRGTWIITEGVRIKMAVQVKRWKVNVQAPTVQNVRGSLATEERGLIITTGDFSPGARKEAEDPKKSSPISLINGEQLVRLLVENNIGVTRTPADILELDTEQAAQPAQK